jgi:RiboL-PSP-HEPN
MPFTSYDAATHAIFRARSLLSGARATGPIRPRGTRGDAPARRPAALPGHTRADMRRLSVVMAVAALDTYMHRLVLEHVYEHKKLPAPLARLDVPFEDLLEQADETARAARQAPHNSRPRVGVKRQLRDRLLRETFQSFDAVSRALVMSGRSKDWRAIGEEMPTPLTPADIKKRLNGIVMRRNQIVHEGDYARLEKPRDPRRNVLSYKQAESDIDFVAALIDAIHTVVVS